MKRLLSDISATPFAVPACSLSLGIVCGYYVDSCLPALLALALTLVATALMLRPHFFREHSVRSRLKFLARNYIWLFALPLFFLAGNLLIKHSGLSENEVEGYTYARGIVKDVSYSTGGDVLTVEISSFISDTGKSIAVKSVPVIVYAGNPAVSPGDDIVFRANLRKADENAPSSDYLYTKGIDFTSGTIDSQIQVVGRDYSLRTYAGKLRDEIVMSIENTPLAQDSKSFICALLVGEKSGLDPELREDFAKAGIAHILSLSGLHAGIILLILGWILLPLNFAGLQNLRYIIMAVGIMVFAFITGMGAPVTRAALMAACMLVARILQRPHTSINALAVAACIILFFNPRQLFDVGFQLSFLCTAAIIVAVKTVNERIKYGFKNKLITAIIIPISVFLVTFPIIAYHFHSVPLMFLPLNLLIVPLMPAFMICALLYLLLAAIGLDFAMLADIIDFSCRFISNGADWVAGFGLSPERIFPHPAVPALGTVAAIVLLYSLRCRSRLSITSASAAYLLMFASILIQPDSMPADSLSIPADYYGLRVKTASEGTFGTIDLRDGAISGLMVSGQTIIYADAPLSKYKGIHAKPDILVIGRNFSGNIEALISRLNPQRVLLSARLYSSDIDSISAVCSRHKLPTHRLTDAPVTLP